MWTASEQHSCVDEQHSCMGCMELHGQHVLLVWASSTAAWAISTASATWTAWATWLPEPHGAAWATLTA
eukprot:351975-Chlamydomonas_euryale.AAC.3